MLVTEITVRFGRKIKPADYEGVDAEVTLKCHVPDGDPAGSLDMADANIANLMSKVKLGALSALGRAEAAGKLPVGTAVSDKVTSTGAAASATTAAAKPKATRTAPVAGPAVVASTAPQIRTNPEDRKGPEDDIPGNATPAKAAAAANDMPEEKPAAAVASSTVTLDSAGVLAYIVSAINEHKGNMAKDCKAVVAKYAPRISEVPAEKLPAVKAEIDKLIEAAKFAAAPAKAVAADPLS